MTIRTITFDDEQWQVVPRRMTVEMLRTVFILADDWRDLLAAAPEPPAQQPMTYEEIDGTTRAATNAMLDYIYEYGTSAEGSSTETTMPDRYQGLRDAIAAGPTRGPWMKATDWNRAAVMRSVEPYTRVVCTGNQNNADRFGAEDWSGSTWTDANYIAAADPDTIAALLKERDALRTALFQLACIEPVRGVDPSALVGSAIVEWNVHVIARAALARLNGDDHDREA